MKTGGYASIDEYIQTFPVEIQKILQSIREAIHSAAPEATEKISYQMPTFDLYGNLVHFAAFKKHIGFYPTPHGVLKYEKELSPYVHAKGSIQFPLDNPMPMDLIAKIVRSRVEENKRKHEEKKGRGYEAGR